LVGGAAVVWGFSGDALLGIAAGHNSLAAPSLGDIRKGLGALQADLNQLGSSIVDGLIQQVNANQWLKRLLCIGCYGGVLWVLLGLLQADTSQLGSSRVDGLVQQVTAAENSGCWLRVRGSFLLLVPQCNSFLLLVPQCNSLVGTMMMVVPQCVICQHCCAVSQSPLLQRSLCGTTSTLSAGAACTAVYHNLPSRL
jgi:hypothetical protein